MLNTYLPIDHIERHALNALMASPFRQWYDTWRPVVDLWDSQLAALENQYGHIGTMQDLDYTLDAPAVIAQIGSIVDDLTVMLAEVQALPKPADIHVQEQVDNMLSGVVILIEVYSAIRDQDYLRIWALPGSVADIS
jgi:hypothetical protein